METDNRKVTDSENDEVQLHDLLHASGVLLAVAGNLILMDGGLHSETFLVIF